MVSDQEPRYRLVDSNGVIRGTLYGKPDGSVAIQETDSGADREVALAPDGTFSAPSVETESVGTENLNNAVQAIEGERTIADAISTAGDGGTVWITPGTYSETVTPRNDQTIVAYGATIDGGTDSALSDDWMGPYQIFGGEWKSDGDRVLDMATAESDNSKIYDVVCDGVDDGSIDGVFASFRDEVILANIEVRGTFDDDNAIRVDSDCFVSGIVEGIVEERGTNNEINVVNL